MDKIYYGDVENRVRFARGYCEAVNSMAKQGIPYLDADKAEKHIRKTAAKFYGEDNKYKGDGSLR